MLKLLVIICLVLSNTAFGGEDCTWGTDCPRDCWFDTAGTGVNEDCGGSNAGLTCAGPACSAKRNGDGIPIRATSVGGVGAIVFAEDFEDPDYTNQASTGDGWARIDTAVFGVGEDFRGSGSAWFDRYGWGTSDCVWREGYPTGTPINGIACDTTTNNHCGTAEYTAGADVNLAGSGDSDAGYCMDIFGNGQEFNEESSGLGIPDCPGDDGLPGTGDDVTSCHNVDGVFDGIQSMRYRNPSGGATGGFVTYDDPAHYGFGTHALDFGSNLTSLGVTMALVYPDNQSTSNVHTTFWKHEEFQGADISLREFWTHGGSQGTFPVGGFIFSEGLTNSTAQALADTSCAVGSFSNNNPGSGNAANINAVFTQATDFPYGKWSCVQAHITGMGTTTTRMRKWLNGTLVFDCTYNGFANQENKYYNAMVFGNYANRASDAQGGPGSAVNQLSGRGLDNFVVTNGSPVSCAEIGGVGGEVGGAPEPPTHSGIVLSLNEPTQDVNGRTLQTLQSCEVERFVDSISIGTIVRPASSPAGGGRWPTDWADGIDLTAASPHCGKTISGRAVCTNAKGKSTVSIPPAITVPACTEGLPKPPTFSLLSVIGDLFRIQTHPSLR